jgi:hypothetical protein
MTALSRVRALLVARLHSGPSGGSPISALLSQAVVAGFFCALVRDALPPFAYGLFALSLTTALVAIPLLGELGWILRRDEAAEWVGALPALERERRVARTLHLLCLLWLLALGSLVPAAVFAPASTAPLARLLLPLLGLGLVSLLAAALLFVQNVLGERAEGLLVAFQTLLVVAVVVGVVLGIRSIPALARLPTLGDEHARFLWFLPPSWFAAPFAAAEGEPARWWLPAGVGLLALVLLVILPSPARARPLRTPWLAVLLAPARWLATRLWLRADERGPFDLVYDALPREREVVLRTVPMIGIPMAFLLIASTGGDDPSAQRADVLALLVFTVGIYLPILLTHVPASASPRASWIHRTAPVSEGAVVSGAVKALAVRFLVPLYLLLGFVAWVQAGPEEVLRLTLPGFLVSLLVLRLLYGVCVDGPPLSTAPDAIRFDLDWSGPLAAVALVLPLGAFAVNRFLGVGGALVLAACLVGAEGMAHRSLRRRLG